MADAESPRPRWLLLALLAVVPFALFLLAKALWQPGPQRVRETTLEASWWGRLDSRAWRDLPFRIDPAEEEAVRRCVELAGRIGVTADGENQFDREETREALEKLLAERPRLFYADHLLGTWHLRNGDAGKAEGHFLRAEANADVVLVQPVLGSDGRPVAGAKVRSVEVECNRVEGGSLDPSLKLRFVGLVTDADGN